MRKIFTTISLLIAAAAVPAAPPELLGESDPGVQSALYDDAMVLSSLFRSPWRNSRTALTLAFSPAVPERSAELQQRSGRWYLMLNGSPGRWNDDFGLRRRIYSALLLAASDAPLTPGESRALPPWVVAALGRQLEARRGEERLLRGNYRAPVLRALMERGKIPEAETVRNTDPERFPKAAQAWAGELSRALFLAGDRKLASPKYLRRCGELARLNLSPLDADRMWNNKDAADAQRAFAAAVRRLAWHDLAPRPARWALRRLDELRRLELPLLDETGKPVPEKSEICDVLELADKLAERPDAAELAALFRRRFFDFCAGDSRRVKAAGFLLADLVGHAHNPPLWYRSRLERALERLYAELRRRERLDACLDREEFRHAPVRRTFRRRLETVEEFNAGSSLLPAESRKWFDVVENGFR